MFRFQLPLILLRNFPRLYSENAIIRSVVGEKVPGALYTSFLMFCFRYLRDPVPQLTTRFPSPHELASFRQPSLVLLSRYDIFTPGDVVASDIRRLFTSGLRAVEILRDHHVLAQHTRAYIQQRILLFLRDDHG